MEPTGQKPTPGTPAAAPDLASKHVSAPVSPSGANAGGAAVTNKILGNDMIKCLE